MGSGAENDENVKSLLQCQGLQTTDKFCSEKLTCAFSSSELIIVLSQLKIGNRSIAAEQLFLRLLSQHNHNEMYCLRTSVLSSIIYKSCAISQQREEMDHIKNMQSWRDCNIPVC